MNGVLTTRCGYCGGADPWPTYGNVLDHTETCQIEFDPTVLSFEAIVARVLVMGGRNHSVSRQIMTAIWTHDADQAKIVADAAAGRGDGCLHVAPFEVFYLAEVQWRRS